MNRVLTSNSVVLHFLDKYLYQCFHFLMTHPKIHPLAVAMVMESEADKRIAADASDPSLAHKEVPMIAGEKSDQLRKLLAANSVVNEYVQEAACFWGNIGTTMFWETMETVEPQFIPDLLQAANLLAVRGMANASQGHAIPMDLMSRDARKILFLFESWAKASKTDATKPE